MEIMRREEGINKNQWKSKRHEGERWHVIGTGKKMDEENGGGYDHISIYTSMTSYKKKRR